MAIQISHNRCVKRVPMDFKWQGIWPGYVPSAERLLNIPELVDRAPYLRSTDGHATMKDICELCHAHSGGKCSEDADYCVLDNEQNRTLWHQDPPEGEGYQLWETTTEGSPLSPVFSSLEELCTWAEHNATLYGHEKVSKDMWYKLLSKKEKKDND